jgi:hypothetical protein
MVVDLTHSVPSAPHEKGALRRSFLLCENFLRSGKTSTVGEVSGFGIFSGFLKSSVRHASA